MMTSEPDGNSQVNADNQKLDRTLKSISRVAERAYCPPAFALSTLGTGH